MEGVSNEELVGELRVICHGHARAAELLAEVEARLEVEPWSIPADVLGALRGAFPEKHTIDAWCRRARHAHAVWLSKYGPFNVEQGEYVRTLLLYVISTAGKDRGKLHGLMEDLVNHENVDQGFKKRRGEDVPVVKFDAMELL